MMHFLWPSTIKHLPNDDQLKLLIALLYKTKFPGFLHLSALKVSESVKDKNLNLRIHYTYTAEMLANSLVTSPYLFIPFSTPHSYIMDLSNSIHGIIMRKTLITYWFEYPISIGEIYTAIQRGIPMLCSFSNLGTSEPCDMCNAYGALDWVDSVLSWKDYNKPPDTRYIWATHKYLNFLIDNHWVHNSNEHTILHPCPACLGLGCKSVLTYTGDEIKEVEFEDHMYSLLLRGSSNEMFECMM